MRFIRFSLTDDSGASAVAACRPQYSSSKARRRDGDVDSQSRPRASASARETVSAMCKSALSRAAGAFGVSDAVDATLSVRPLFFLLFFLLRAGLVLPAPSSSASSSLITLSASFCLRTRSASSSASCCFVALSRSLITLFAFIC